MNPDLGLLKPYPFDDVTAKVRTIVEGEGVTFVDLLPSVEKLDPASLWVTVRLPPAVCGVVSGRV